MDQKDLRLRAKTIKLVEEIIRENFYDVRFGNGLLNMIPNAQVTEEKNR